MTFKWSAEFISPANESGIEKPKKERKEKFFRCQKN